jgi:hypothetical protein
MAAPVGSTCSWPRGQPLGCVHCAQRAQLLHLLLELQERLALKCQPFYLPRLLWQLPVRLSLCAFHAPLGAAEPPIQHVEPYGPKPAGSYWGFTLLITAPRYPPS